MNANGTPMLPVLTELVEIPHNIDVSIEVLGTSNDTDSGYSYNVRPAAPVNYPVGVGRNSTHTPTIPSTILPTVKGPVYYNSTLFPRVRTNIIGRTGTAPLITRGHRLLKLSFYPVQYNPVTGFLRAFSQIVVKIRYSAPAQIQPVREALRSRMFDWIFTNSLIHYDPIHVKYQQQPGIANTYIRTPPPPPSMPNATVPQYLYSSSPSPSDVRGAEYLIITNDTFAFQAHRLAEWKERKGTPSAVIVIESRTWDEKITEIKECIEYAYDHWNPVPTYVLLFGDVEAIPTNKAMEHPGWMFERGNAHIASDLGYFIIEGHSYFPDMIYGRISVDTVEQAEIIVNKTINYEQSPKVEPHFFNSIMTAGFFEDWDHDGVEEEIAPWVYHLEKIREYLKDELKYNVHYNYSCDGKDDYIPLRFHTRLNDSDPESNSVRYIIENYDDVYDWLWAYMNSPYPDNAEGNITANIDDGRFLVLYYGHGGSKNMLYKDDHGYDPEFGGPDGVHDNDDRDVWEGWTYPFFNTSYMPALANGNMTPLIVSIACSTGWFDGESDHLFMDLDQFDGDHIEENPFSFVNEESFAEEILRLESGAIAAIAPTRPAPGKPSADLLNGMIQAIWPGFLKDGSQPIYEMGGILLAGKLNAASKWMGKEDDPARQMFEAFHLFGDPETRLWTEEPVELNVTRPMSIGTSTSQKFVVTVRNNETQEPISYAKVCIQQDLDIYQVGYTDTRGQVVFEVDPLDVSSSLNVTVTKQNHVPYLGEIAVCVSEKAQVTPTARSAIAGKLLEVSVSGFYEDAPIDVYFDGYEGTKEIVYTQTQSVGIEVPEGPYEYLNLRAEQDAERGFIVATTTVLRLSSALKTDPYVYSLFDYTTWDLTDEDGYIWDNPCITIYDGATPVKRVAQGADYTVNVTVYNRGSVNAERCNVTLSYARDPGGVSWGQIDTVYNVFVPLTHPIEVSFSWSPLLADTASLKVTLEAENEIEEDKVNNVGYECWTVFPACVKADTSFHVGNPTEETDYVFINVKQVGHNEDIWSAEIQDYSSKPIDNEEDEEVRLEVSPSEQSDRGESRSFTAEFYIKGE
ncbi:MAG: C25 family cysteine peptidase, partial [Candidatus Thorarchaeota archaeon]